jgi:hypothetical protein
MSKKNVRGKRVTAGMLVLAMTGSNMVLGIGPEVYASGGINQVSIAGKLSETRKGTVIPHGAVNLSHNFRVKAPASIGELVVGNNGQGIDFVVNFNNADPNVRDDGGKASFQIQLDGANFWYGSDVVASGEGTMEIVKAKRFPQATYEALIEMISRVDLGVSPQAREYILYRTPKVTVGDTDAGIDRVYRAEVEVVLGILGDRSGLAMMAYDGNGWNPNKQEVWNINSPFSGKGMDINLIDIVTTTASVTTSNISEVRVLIEKQAGELVAKAKFGVDAPQVFVARPFSTFTNTTVVGGGINSWGSDTIAATDVEGYAVPVVVIAEKATTDNIFSQTSMSVVEMGKEYGEFKDSIREYESVAGEDNALNILSLHQSRVVGQRVLSVEPMINTAQLELINSVGRGILVLEVLQAFIDGVDRLATAGEVMQESKGFSNVGETGVDTRGRTVEYSGNFPFKMYVSHVANTVTIEYDRVNAGSGRQLVVPMVMHLTKPEDFAIRVPYAGNTTGFNFPDEIIVGKELGGAQIATVASSDIAFGTIRANLTNISVVEGASNTFAGSTVGSSQNARGFYMETNDRRYVFTNIGQEASVWASVTGANDTMGFANTPTGAVQIMSWGQYVESSFSNAQNQPIPHETQSFAYVSQRGDRITVILAEGINSFNRGQAQIATLHFEGLGVTHDDRNSPVFGKVSLRLGDIGPTKDDIGVRGGVNTKEVHVATLEDYDVTFIALESVPVLKSGVTEIPEPILNNNGNRFILDGLDSSSTGVNSRSAKVRLAESTPNAWAGRLSTGFRLVDVDGKVLDEYVRIAGIVPELSGGNSGRNHFRGVDESGAQPQVHGTVWANVVQPDGRADPIWFGSDGASFSFAGIERNPEVKVPVDIEITLFLSARAGFEGDVYLEMEGTKEVSGEKVLIASFESSISAELVGGEYGMESVPALPVYETIPNIVIKESSAGLLRRGDIELSIRSRVGMQDDIIFLLPVKYEQVSYKGDATFLGAQGLTQGRNISLPLNRESRDTAVEITLSDLYVASMLPVHDGEFDLVIAGNSIADNTHDVINTWTPDRNKANGQAVSNGTQRQGVLNQRDLGYARFGFQEGYVLREFLSHKIESSEGGQGTTEPIVPIVPTVPPTVKPPVQSVYAVQRIELDTDNRAQMKADGAVRVLMADGVVTPAINIDGGNLVPFRALGEVIGADVVWINATNAETAGFGGASAILTVGNKSVRVQNGSNQMWINGVAKTMEGRALIVIEDTVVDAPSPRPETVVGRFYVPLRILEGFDWDVTWERPKAIMVAPGGESEELGYKPQTNTEGSDDVIGIVGGSNDVINTVDDNTGGDTDLDVVVRDMAGDLTVEDLIVEIEKAGIAYDLRVDGRPAFRYNEDHLKGVHQYEEDLTARFNYRGADGYHTVYNGEEVFVIYKLVPEYDISID